MCGIMALNILYIYHTQYMHDCLELPPEQIHVIDTKAKQR